MDEKKDFLDKKRVRLIRSDFLRLTKLVEGISSFGDTISIIAIVIMTLSVFYNVVMRYVLNAPTLWAEEVNGYLIVLMTCAGASELLKKRKHINLTIFTQRLNEKNNKVLETFMLLATLFWTSIITWKSLQLAINAFRYDMRESSPLLTPLVIPYSFFVIGFFVLSLQALIMILKNINDITDK